MNYLPCSIETLQQSHQRKVEGHNARCVRLALFCEALQEEEKDIEHNVYPLRRRCNCATRKSSQRAKDLCAYFKLIMPQLINGTQNLNDGQRGYQPSQDLPSSAQSSVTCTLAPVHSGTVTLPTLKKYLLSVKTWRGEKNCCSLSWKAFPSAASPLRGSPAEC
mmetsp:Transcript_45209/g.117006  ORF Transcript_45209/g.117006 Transcript_45209/m.117006 type:complete len:163 (-) Transcript_45209:1199-1687(-)